MPREIDSGVRVFAQDLPVQAFRSLDDETEIRTGDVVLPQRVPAPDEEIGFGTLPSTADLRDVVLPQPATITIYVRKGDHAKERIISINPIPAGVDPLALLNAGFALDGNSATLSVNPYTFAYDGDEEAGNIEGIRSWTPGGTLPGEWALAWSMTKAVNCIERLLVNWLTKKLGCSVKFG